MSKSKDPVLAFDFPFDERTQLEAKARGYSGHVKVRLGGRTYSVVFYDCVRLAQDLEYEVSTGRMCVADPGMIVLSEVTLENMETAVKALADEDYFNSLTCLEDLAKAPDATASRSTT
jgi:hypothetical protein